MSLKKEWKLGPLVKLVSLGCAPGDWVDCGITTQIENVGSENRFVGKDDELGLGYPGGCWMPRPEAWERHLGRRETLTTILSQVTLKTVNVCNQCRGRGLEGSLGMPLF